MAELLRKSDDYFPFDKVDLEKRVDFAGGLKPVYVGHAMPGSLTASPAWQIFKNHYRTCAETYDVVHAASPGGNPIYVKFDAGGRPYLCCNMATDEADKVLTIGSHKVVITHDASAGTGGIRVYFDEDGAADAQLLANNTITGVDCYVATSYPNLFLKVKHDADAATNGVAISYDDDTDEQIEATFAGEADVTLSATWSGTDDVERIEWAGGTNKYNQIWDNRASLFE